MRINRPASLFVSIALLASVVVGYSTTASAAPSSKADKSSFWNAERINKAIAFDMVFEPGSKIARRVPAARTSSKPNIGTTTSVLGTSWVSGGLPLTASGKVFYAIGSSYYQCSGALVRDGKSDLSVVLTAGHCVFDNAKNTYATYWIFIPSYDLAQVSISGCSASTNCWAASSVHANNGFTSQTGFTTQATLFDWGFAKITELKNGKLPDGGDGSVDGNNSFPISFSELPLGTSVSAFGYPAAGRYKGKDLVYSTGKIGIDSSNGVTYSFASDMTGGASGGPWLSGFGTSSNSYSGTLSSVNSYKYGTSNFMYGPRFNSETEATYLSARNQLY